MDTRRCSLRAFFTGITLLAFSGFVNANLVSFSITGDPQLVGAGNPFGLSACIGTCSETISATGIFDDSVLSNTGSEFVYFGNGSGNSITTHVGSIDFLETMDNNYAGGMDPFLEFMDGALVSINLLFNSGTNGAPADFTSSGIIFGSGSVLSGLWDTNSFTTTVVPVPAAVWLFGSGLLGLVGIARRRKAIV